MSTSDDAPPARSIAESELRGLLGQVERRRNGARLLLVASEPTWEGPEVLDTEAGPVRVVPGPSPLAVRVALTDHPDDFLIVLTPLTVEELGEEIAARAWRGNVRRPSPWDAVTSLFRVSQVDPSLRDEGWMVDLLVRLAPRGGYPQPPSQILDRGTAWRTVYKDVLELSKPQPSSTELLRWATTETAEAAVGRLSADERERIATRLAIDVTAAAAPLLERAAAGQGHDIVPLGLVVDALWPNPDPVGKALLQERYLDRETLTDPAALEWGRAAVSVVEQRLAGRTSSEEVTGWMRDAERILAELGAEGTSDSSVLERGFVGRLAQLGSALGATLETRQSAELRASERALDRVASHLMAERSSERVETARAAFRLVRRTVAESDPSRGSDDLTALTSQYLDDGSWVDAARNRIAEGETVMALADVYETLLQRVDPERQQRDRAFARAVANEATGPPLEPSIESDRPLRIEQVLDAVVAPLAEQLPVLLLVIDGLSHPSAVPLLEDLRNDGWLPHGPQGRRLPAVVAALPTVTVVSRASLLTGQLIAGGQDVERDGFANNQALREASGGGSPQLFHKSDLKTAGGEVAPAPRDAIADPSNRVVGVVVNAVDDHLDRGQQLRLADGLEGVPLMRPLLNAALEAGRAVVLTSDHGHILGAHQRVVAPNGGGERFRLDDESPTAEDEILLHGQRVLRGDGRIVGAADDGVRYIGPAKHGYHGGATPAEVLCPLVVLCSRQTSIQGWEPLPPYAPSWWNPELAPIAVDLDSSRTSRDETDSEITGEPQLSLLEPEPRATQREQVRSGASPELPDWLDELLTSPRLADQRRLAGRATLDDDDLATVLRVLIASGGTASGGALQRTLDIPATRLRGKLEAARNLLNVEGYQVLKIEADGTAVLNSELLARQFEVTRPPEVRTGAT